MARPAPNRTHASWPSSPPATGELVPRHRDSVHGVEIDSESVLYDAVSGRLHHLNWSASAVWWSVDGATSAEALAAELAGQFHVSPEAMRDDVLRLLGMLGAQQLIEAVPSRERAP